MNTLQTLEAALSAEREAKQLIIADWNKAEHRARQRQNELEAEIAVLRTERAPLQADKARLDSGTILLTVGGERICFVGVDLRAAIEAGRKEAQP